LLWMLKVLVQIYAQKNSMIKHWSNWEAILCISFFQDQKSTDIASIWSVQIVHYFVQIDIGCLRTTIEHQEKEEANACYFNTRFNYYCTQSGYWLTLHRTFSDCCCWQRNIGIVQETLKSRLSVQFCIISLLLPPHEEELKHATLWLVMCIIIHFEFLKQLSFICHVWVDWIQQHVRALLV
jgi:hypothetical protein